jgi:hypothetical protein
MLSDQVSRAATLGVTLHSARQSVDSNITASASGVSRSAALPGHLTSR